MLIPIGDDQGRRGVTIVSWAICAAWIGVFVAMVAGSKEQVALQHGQLVVSTESWWASWARIESGDAGDGVQAWLEVAQPLATYWLLHGGVFHVLANVLAVAVCGTRIEARIGSLGFASFCLLLIVGSGLFELLQHSGEHRDLLGGSGLAAGLWLSYLATLPRARAVALVPVAVVVPVIVELPMWVLLVCWGVVQLRPLTRLLEVGPAEPMSFAALGAGAALGLVAAPVVLLLGRARRRGSSAAKRSSSG